MDDELIALQGKLKRVATAFSQFVPTRDKAHALRRDVRDLLSALEARKQRWRRPKSKQPGKPDC